MNDDALWQLVDVDGRITDLERELQELKAERSQRVRELTDSGVTRYRIAKVTGRTVSTVNRW